MYQYRRVNAGYCTSLLATASLLCWAGSLGAAEAEFTNEPYRVCPLETFEVAWEGPDAAGDVIVIADIDAPVAARDYDFALTDEGNPLLLTAPPRIGEYRLRYVQPGGNAMLEEEELHVVDCSTSCRVREYAVDKYAVEVHGIQSSSGERVIEHGPIKIKDLCRAASAVAPVIRDVVGRAGGQLGLSSAEIDAQVSNQLSNAQSALCSVNEDQGTANWSTFVYSHCRMAGQSGAYTMDIHLPPGTGDGTMSIADHSKRQVMRMTLRRNVAAASVSTGEGWSSGINMSLIGSGSRLGYPTKEYDFNYNMGLGVGAAGALDADQVDQVTSPQMLGNLVSVNVSGTAHLAQCIPGGNILTEYHDRLARELQFDDSGMGAFAGIVKNQVGMLEHGIPLDITSQTSGKIAGMPMMMGTDRTVITGFDIVPLPPRWCIQSLMPEDYEVVDIDEQVQQAMNSAGGAGAGGGGMSPEQQRQMDDAMRQMNEAMESMTPEQRKAMEGAGLGGLLGGMFGGGKQADAPTSSASSAAPTGSKSSKSKDLQGSSLTHTAQNYLKELGYDVGAGNGQMNLETTIAISQFQAENKMEVTGEVTPQLIGILAAKVDSR